MSSSRGSISATGSTTAANQKQANEQQGYKKKPPPLDLNAASADSNNAVAASASSDQKTPPIPQSATAVDLKEKKIGHRRVDEHTGQVTYKKKATSDLMKSIQLGIGQSVGSLTSKPTRDVLMQDFSVVETVHFPENGSNLTPAHRVGEFKFKTYAPVAFRYFRELFGIRTDDFLVSLCSQQLTELSNPGASGSVFFITEDDEFIVKTVQHKEADFLQKLLPGYYMNLNQNPRTLLPKFYGLYCYQSGGKNIRLCVMNNLLPSAIRMSEKYDLKGSTYKRKASKHELAKSSPTYKDLDYKDRHSDGVLLEADTFEALMKTMRRDCRVLESFKIMDYSLLLAVYNVDEIKTKKREELEGGSQALITSDSQMQSSMLNPQPTTSNSTTSASSAGAEAGIAVPGAINRGRSTKQRLQQWSTAMESIQADTDPVELEDDDIPPGGIPARNAKGERLLLYMGIIDILQSYRLKKKLEHGFKSIVHDGDSISVHRPSFYAQRFQSFFEKEVFKKIASLQQMKRPPGFIHVTTEQSAAMRSPSKKKATARQRASTDPVPHDNRTSTDAGGMMVHRSKPDLIPHQASTDTALSSNIYDPRWSQNTLLTNTTATTVTTSSASTAGHSYNESSHVSVSRDTTPNQLLTNQQLMNVPTDHSDDPLPPYSEMASGSTPPVTPSILIDKGSSEGRHMERNDQTEMVVRSKFTASSPTQYNPASPTKEESVDVRPTSSAPTVSPDAAEVGKLNDSSELQTKSSFRKDKTDGIPVAATTAEQKKGVRFISTGDLDLSQNTSSHNEPQPDKVALDATVDAAADNTLPESEIDVASVSDVLVIEEDGLN